ncbi:MULTISPECIES: family 20 glycosylhydrolase [unclassified Carboxylicivirga]|uniref:family 20 glycosylhydrolase n=1 Tax=Carboxylicivirga TaxID=1628153 RepID=UPI003D330BBA
MNKFIFSISLMLLLISCRETEVIETYSIIPQPNSLRYADEYLTSDKTFNLQANHAEGVTLRDVLMSKADQYALTFSQGSDATPLLLMYDASLSNEAYRLVVDTEKITISASSQAGWLYGFHSVVQMLPVGDAGTFQLRCGTIEDAPRFVYRGMHLDVSRHFFDLEEVKEMVDQMVHYKLNKLHLHLTDDQGWRLQIDKYPLLTQMGAWREHNGQDSTCLEKAVEDATFIIPEKHYRIINGKRMYGGFYTKAQMKELIDYCQQRNIEIIPEIDIPGHFKAAIDNYPYLSCSGEAGWGTHFSYPACLGKASTYEFIENVLSEVAELFPSKYIHIGGDEVNKDEWKRCKKCQRAIRKAGLKNEHELQSHFNHHIEEFLAAKGKQLMGWDEIVEGGVSEHSTVMWWRNWAPNTIRDAAKNGNDVIVTPDFEYYFDFTHAATPLSKVYNFEPVPDDFTEAMAARVLGVQANIWTEGIPNTDRLYYQSLPRMLALAESGWTAKDLKSYSKFEERLPRHYRYFESQDLFYHLPVLGAYEDETVFIQNTAFQLEIPLEGMTVYYTLDGSTPTQQSAVYEGPVAIDQACTVRFRAYKGDVFSKIYEAKYTQQTPADAVEASVQPGLHRSYVEGRYWNCKDVPLTNIAAAQTRVDDFGLGQYEGQSNYALVFEGYFKAEEEGVYTFYTNSDDGDQLSVHGNIIVDNNPSHGPRMRRGSIALKAGLHPLQLIYCQIGGGAVQEVFVETPGQEKRLVQPAELFCKIN